MRLSSTLDVTTARSISTLEEGATIGRRVACVAICTLDARELPKHLQERRGASIPGVALRTESQHAFPVLAHDAELVFGEPQLVEHAATMPGRGRRPG